MTNNIIIKSGIDINSIEFKKYLAMLKREGKKFYYLDLAIFNNSEVLSNPIIFDETEFSEYKVDDISFIIENNEIIGHMFYVLNKKRPTISLGNGPVNHLDCERLKQLNGTISFNKIEYFCKNDIDIKDIIINYLSNRIHNKLEYRGNISVENKIRIKK